MESADYWSELSSKRSLEYSQIRASGGLQPYIRNKCPGYHGPMLPSDRSWRIHWRWLLPGPELICSSGSSDTQTFPHGPFGHVTAGSGGKRAENCLWRDGDGDESVKHTSTLPRHFMRPWSVWGRWVDMIKLVLGKKLSSLGFFYTPNNRLNWSIHYSRRWTIVNNHIITIDFFPLALI